MKFYLSLSVIIDAVGVLQGIIFAFILLWENKKKTANILLAVFLFTYSAEFTGIALEEFALLSLHPILAYLPINFYFAIIPLLYLYTKSLTHNLNWKHDYKHLIPGAFELVIGLVAFLFLLIFGVPEETEELTFLSVSTIIYYLAVIPFTIFYSVKLFIYVQRFNKRASDYYSNLNGKNLRWTYRLAIMNLGMGVASITLLFFPEKYVD